MNISQRLSLQQRQSPQQVLLSTLLQLPVLRLEQRIKQELEINPLLELEMEDEMDQIEDQEMESKEEDEEEDVHAEENEEDKIDWETILNDEGTARGRNGPSGTVPGNADGSSFRAAPFGALFG
jgi:RNA polymerase sigma-54 factor